MSFAVVAELPLGAYRAHGPERELDPLPAPARLHAALLCAAAQGPRAVADGALLQPCPEDAAALAWLEEHPPDGVALPRHARVSSRVIAYRREGTLVKEGSDPGPKDKVFGKSDVGLVAVDGPFAWTWDEAPPAAVRASLAALCPDVSHLGTVETPARLRVGDAVPTHRRDPAADLFSGVGLDLDVAETGRTVALQREYRRVQKTPPTRVQDRYKTTERAMPPPVSAAARAPARYVAPAPDEPQAPWAVVQLARLEPPTGNRNPLAAPEYRVGWAVAVHRALIDLIGDGAPPVLTGVYPPQLRRPANRVAIQFLVGDAAWAAGLDGTVAHLALLLPAGAHEAELAAVAAAAARLGQVRRAGMRIRVAEPTTRSARSFWPAPAAGCRRSWRTEPVVIPDTRPPRGGPWSLAEAATLSVGLTLRDRLAPPGRGSTWYRQVAAAATGAGVRVRATRRVTDGDLSRYVHKVAPGTVVQPYRAVLDLGGLVGDRALVAMGQSRHLGGGLLVPLDVAEDAAT